MKNTIEFLQNGGADETLKAASEKWASENPGRRVVAATFKSARPAGPDGRWVEIEIDHELDRSYAAAD